MDNLLIAYIGLVAAKADTTSPARAVSCSSLSLTSLEEAYLDSRAIQSAICSPPAANSSSSSTAVTNTSTSSQVSLTPSPSSNFTAGCDPSGRGPRCSFSTSLQINSNLTTTSTSTVTNLTTITGTALTPTTGVCTSILCADYINACSIPYGGCYPACSGFTAPTFSVPPCLSTTSSSSSIRGPFTYNGPWVGPSYTTPTSYGTVYSCVPVSTVT